MGNIIGTLISILTFPGVIVHEWAHKFFCDRANVPVYEVVYFRLGNPAGYVAHAPIVDYKEKFLVSVGPFIVNTLLALCIFLVARLIDFSLPRLWFVELAFLIVFWLGLSIGMHALPSRGDAINLWKASKENWRHNYIAMLGFPIVGMIYIADALKMFFFDFIYALVLWTAVLYIEWIYVFLLNPLITLDLLVISIIDNLILVPFVLGLATYAIIKRKAYERNYQGGESRSPEGENHLEHWLTTLNSSEALDRAIVDSVENSDAVDTVKFRDMELDYFYKGKDGLKVCSVALEDKVLTSYPLVSDGVEHPVNITNLNEWDNGVEAVLDTVLNSRSISFYDTLYSQNTPEYKEGTNLYFSLGGIAFNLDKKENKKYKGFETNKPDIKPLNKVSSDEYILQSRIKKVEAKKFMGDIVYRIEAPLFVDNQGKEIDFTLYASRNAVGNYNPSIGDEIIGTIWLQGYMTSKTHPGR